MSESPNPLSVRRWEPLVVDVGGAQISMEVRRPNALEGAPFRIALAGAHREYITLQEGIGQARLALPPEPAMPEGMPDDLPDGATDEARAEYSARVQAFEAEHPEYVAALAHYVAESSKMTARVREAHARMNVAIPRDIIAEIFTTYVRNVAGLVVDDVPATTGAALLEVADETIIGAVVGKVRQLAEIGLGEGKASAPRSTSSLEPMPSGASGASSTDAVGGTLP